MQMDYLASAAPTSRASYVLPGLVLAVAIAVPPLVPAHTVPLAGFYAEWVSAAVFCAAIFWSAAISRQGVAHRHALFPLVALAPLWLIACTLVQEGVGVQDWTGRAPIAGTTLALGAVVMLAIWRYAGTGRPPERAVVVSAIATGWLAAGLLGTLAEWIQVFHLESNFFGWISNYDLSTTNRRLWGNLNQPNHQATVNGLALAGAIWLGSTARIRFPLWLAVAAWLESGIILTGSRTGLAHIGVGAVYLLVLAFLARCDDAGAVPPLMKRARGLVTAAIALLAIAVLVQSGIDAASKAFGWNLANSMSRIGEAEQLAYRSVLWAHAWAMFQSHPLLGVGWGEFAWAQFEQMAVIGKTAGMSLHAHNAILDLLAKTGVFGTVGLGLALLAWLYRVICIRILRGGAEDRRQTIMIMACLAMLGAHSMLEYPLHYTFFFLPCCLMLGFLETGGIGFRAMPAWFNRLAVYSFALVSMAVLTTLWLDYQTAELGEQKTGAEFIGAPQPLVWFRPWAEARSIEKKTVTSENNARLLPQHIVAVHSLPTQNMVTRTAWLMALSGDTVQARVWLERLPYYYKSDEHVVYVTVRDACRAASPEMVPREFCQWIESQADRTAKESTEKSREHS